MSRQKLNLKTRTEKCSKESSSTRRHRHSGEDHGAGGKFMKSQFPEPRLRLIIRRTFFRVCQPMINKMMSVGKINSKINFSTRHAGSSTVRSCHPGWVARGHVTQGHPGGSHHVPHARPPCSSPATPVTRTGSPYRHAWPLGPLPETLETRPLRFGSTWRRRAR